MNDFTFPSCPDANPDCLGGGIDLHIHVSPDGRAEIVSATPSACSESSPYDFWEMLRERGFRAFAVRAPEDAIEH